MVAALTDSINANIFIVYNVENAAILLLTIMLCKAVSELR